MEQRAENGHMRQSKGCTAFWSYGSRQQAGVLLLITNSFLQILSIFEWKEAEPGRVAVLRLDGELGSLDNWIIYLWIGNKRRIADKK